MSSKVVLEGELDDGSFAGYRRAGRGERTCPSCGTFKRFMVCLNTDAHNVTTLDGENHRNQVYVHPVFWSCDKPSCPVCHVFGWAVREASKIQQRFAGANGALKPEHIVVSPPPRDYGLSVRALHHKAVAMARARGVVGGVVIYHQERYNRRRYWYLSPHFHFIAFLGESYNRCRRCEKLPFANKGACAGCSGFEGLTRKLNEKDGWIVKVAMDEETGLVEERKSVGGTAWYQLSHSTYRVAAKRHNVATWFGTCSYCKLKVKVEERKRVCPLCHGDLVEAEYCGHDEKVLALMRHVHCVKKDKLAGDFWSDMYEDGVAVWIEVPRGDRYG